MGYRLGPPPEGREPMVPLIDTTRQSYIVVENGTISRINVPCFYARRFTRRDRMIWDHMGWPGPGRPDRSDYAQVLAINDIDLETEGYTSVVIVLSEDAPSGLSVTGVLDYNFIELRVFTFCEDAISEDVETSFAVYLSGDNDEAGQLMDLVTKGVIHIKAGLINRNIQPIQDNFVISYNGNGGIGNMDNQYVDVGSSVTIRANQFLRTSYDFTGWNTSARGTGMAYSANQVITPKRNILLYAQWEYDPEPEPGPDPDPDPQPTEFTISYDPNGGVGTVSDQVVTSGDSVTLQQNGYTRDGYEFNSWNTSSSGMGTFYSAGQLVYPTGSMTLYAQWTAITPVETYYTIRYNANGGSGWMNGHNVVPGNSFSVRQCSYTPPTGYRFLAWSTWINGEQVIVHPNNTITPTEDMTITAIWGRG